MAQCLSPRWKDSRIWSLLKFKLRLSRLLTKQEQKLRLILLKLSRRHQFSKLKLILNFKLPRLNTEHWLKKLSLRLRISTHSMLREDIYLK